MYNEYIPTYTYEEGTQGLVIEVNPTTELPTGHYLICNDTHKLDKYWRSSDHVVVLVPPDERPEDVFCSLVSRHYYTGKSYWTWNK